jgi:hypothetical protein
LGSFHGCAVTTSNEGICWGLNTQEQVSIPLGSWGIVTAGGQHSCGVRLSGEVECWGKNTSRQSDPPELNFQ